MEPPLDWAQWFAVALPVSAISILLIWLLLLASYRPTTTIDGEPLVIREIRPTREKFTMKQYWVVFVCIVTIGLWLVEKEIESYVGDMGIIAIIPIVAFFSTGVLRKARSCFPCRCGVHWHSYAVLGWFWAVFMDYSLLGHGWYRSWERCNFFRTTRNYGWEDSWLRQRPIVLYCGFGSVTHCSGMVPTLNRRRNIWSLPHRLSRLSLVTPSQAYFSCLLQRK